VPDSYTHRQRAARHGRAPGNRAQCKSHAYILIQPEFLAQINPTDLFVHRVEKWFLERMSDSMQIESLWTFNEKFQPEWHPRYACYDSPEHLLPASIAVARAESFWELPVIGRFFAPRASPSPSSRATPV